MSVWQDPMISDILDLVSIQSFTDDLDGIKKCQEKVAEVAERFGFEWRIAGKGRVVVVTPKGCSEKPKLGIITHIDTVPFDPKEWKYSPLGEIVDGRMYGRGVIDDKAAVIHSLYAMHELEGRIEPSWQLIIGSSEEGEWVDMAEYLKENPVLPEFSFTADGDGIQNGCRGTLNISLKFFRVRTLRHFKMFEVVNPVWNTTPMCVKMRTQNGEYREYKGEGKHSSLEGIKIADNAIYKAYIDNKWYFQREFPYFGKFMELLNKDSSGKYLFLSDYRIKDDTIPGTNVIPVDVKMSGDVLSLSLNVRLGPGVKNYDVHNAVRAMKYEYKCKVSVYESILGGYVPKDSDEIKLMLECYKDVLGIETECTFARGTGYNAAFPNCTIFGPRFAIDHDEEDFCHQVDESRSLEDIRKFHEMLKVFIGRYLKKK